MTTDGPLVARRAVAPTALLGLVSLVAAAGGLVAFKASSALAAVARARRTGTMAAKVGWIAVDSLSPTLRPFAGVLNYFAWVLIALVFGIVLGAIVRALVPDRWLARTLGRAGLGGILLAALAGMPLMLCSCCVAPLFEGVYARTRRLGPALGLAFAAPALNPAALVLTFLLFPRSLAVARLVLAIGLVVLGSASVERVSRSAELASVACPVDAVPDRPRAALRAFGRALVDVAKLSLPAIGLGVVLSVVLIQNVSLGALSAAGARVPIVLAVAAVAVAIAVPTFGEIPLALGLLEVGAPPGAVLALLVAGPAINLPSLLTIRSAVSTRVALTAAAVAYAVSAGGGLAFDLFS